MTDKRDEVRRARLRLKHAKLSQKAARIAAKLEGNVRGGRSPMSDDEGR
jgi:hypothetical protein